MPEYGILASFVVAAFIVVIVPGVTVSAIVGTALVRGLAAGLWMELGVQLGRLSMVLVVALALEAVTSAVSVAFDVIKYAGAAYLVWLGWGYIARKHHLDTTRASAERTPLRQVLSGFVVLWTNPKALIFFGAFLPQFVDPRFAAWPQVIVLGLIEMGAGLITDCIYIALAARAGSALADRRADTVNRIAGVLLIGAAIYLALSHRTAL